jgi:DNA polymerase V
MQNTELRRFDPRQNLDPNGELTIKRLRITPTGVVLQADNPRFPDIEVPALSDLTIWGVATRCLHHV